MWTERPGTPEDSSKVEEMGGKVASNRDTLEAAAADADNVEEGSDLGQKTEKGWGGGGRQPAGKLGR